MGHDNGIEDLAVSILDAFGKGYLYCREDDCMHAQERLKQLLENHKTQRKLIIVSHIDWIFSDGSVETKEKFESFINTLTQTNTSFIFTLKGLPDGGFSKNFPYEEIHVQPPALDAQRYGLNNYLETALAEFFEFINLDEFENILKVSGFKMELLTAITSEITGQSSFAKQPFEMTCQFMEEMTKCSTLNGLMDKLTEKFSSDEWRLLHLLRLYPYLFQFDNCLCATDENFSEQKIKTTLTMLMRKDVVRQVKPGMFFLSNLIKEHIAFEEVPPEIKKMFIVNVLQGFSTQCLQADPYMIMSQRKNLRCALAMMDLEKDGVICFHNWVEIRDVILDIGVENFPIILDNMMSNLGGRYNTFFKTVLKKCSESIKNGSVDEEWLKVLLNPSNSQSPLASAIDPVLVICFEKYMAIAERVRYSREDDWDALSTELEQVKQDLSSCEDIDNVSKLNAQINPLEKNLRCFEPIYYEMSQLLDQIKKGELDISAMAVQRNIKRKIEAAINSPCNIIKELSVELRVEAEIQITTLMGNQEEKRKIEEIKTDHKGDLVALQNELVKLKEMWEGKEAEWMYEREQLLGEREQQLMGEKERLMGEKEEWMGKEKELKSKLKEQEGENMEWVRKIAELSKLNETRIQNEAKWMQEKTELLDEKKSYENKLKDTEDHWREEKEKWKVEKIEWIDKKAQLDSEKVNLEAQVNELDTVNQCLDREAKKIQEDSKELQQKLNLALKEVERMKIMYAKNKRKDKIMAKNIRGKPPFKLLFGTRMTKSAIMAHAHNRRRHFRHHFSILSSGIANWHNRGIVEATYTRSSKSPLNRNRGPHPQPANYDSIIKMAMKCPPAPPTHKREIEPLLRTTPPRKGRPPRPDSASQTPSAPPPPSPSSPPSPPSRLHLPASPHPPHTSLLSSSQTNKTKTKTVSPALRRAVRQAALQSSQTAPKAPPSPPQQAPALPRTQPRRRPQQAKGPGGRPDHSRSAFPSLFLGHFP